MQGLQQFLAFAQTARRGSFAAAARDLGGSPSTLAKSVARLETGLGVKLFHRTTRQVTLTADGERLFHRCERVLAEFEDLKADASGVRAAPSGTLRLDVPVFYGRRFVLPILAKLQCEHPALVFEVRLRDGFADLVKDGIDLAVRAGALSDSSLVARRIDSQGLVLVASPAYLRAHGTPRAAGRPGRAQGGGVSHADQRAQPPLAAQTGPPHRRAACAARGADQRHRGAGHGGAARPGPCASCPTTSSRTSWRAASWSRCCPRIGRRRCRSARWCLRAGSCRPGCGSCSTRWRHCATGRAEPLGGFVVAAGDCC
jgi:DNA-binding transcriptional LysR family regulator